VCVCVCARARVCLCVRVFGLRSMHLSTIDRSPCFSLLSLSPCLTQSLTVSLSPSLSRALPFSPPFSHALVYAIASEVLLLYLRKGVISPLCHERSDSPALPLSRSPLHAHSHAEHTSKTTARGSAQTSSLQLLNVSISMISNYTFFYTRNILARQRRKGLGFRIQRLG